MRADCDAGVIIMEPTEYPPMSGSNLICTVTVLLETGILPMREPETIVMVDTPAGPVRARATCGDGKCRSVELANVPCFALMLDAAVEVDGVGRVVLDIAYGGMFYAIVDATRLGFAVTAAEARDLANWLGDITFDRQSRTRVLFIEPNLSFEFVARDADIYELRLYFALESCPPGIEAYSDEFSLSFTVTAEALRLAANHLCASLRNFPIRANPGRSYPECREV